MWINMGSAPLNVLPDRPAPSSALLARELLRAQAYAEEIITLIPAWRFTLERRNATKWHGTNRP
jgi:hypothetical protein